MNDDQKTSGPPGGPLFIALDRAGEIPKIRKAMRDRGIDLMHVSLDDGENVHVSTADAGRPNPDSLADGEPYSSTICRIETGVSGNELKIEILVVANTDGVAPLSRAMTHLHAGLFALDTMLSPPCETADAEFTCEPASAVDFLLSVWPTFKGDPSKGLFALAEHLRADPKWRQIAGEDAEVERLASVAATRIDVEIADAACRALGIWGYTDRADLLAKIRAGGDAHRGSIAELEERMEALYLMACTFKVSTFEDPKEIVARLEEAAAELAGDVSEEWSDADLADWLVGQLRASSLRIRAAQAEHESIERLRRELSMHEIATPAQIADAALQPGNTVGEIREILGTKSGYSVVEHARRVADNLAYLKRLHGEMVTRMDEIRAALGLLGSSTQQDILARIERLRGAERT